MGFFDKIKKLNIFSGFSAIDDDFYDELEETLILSDMGMDTTLKAVEELKSRVKGEKIKDEEGVRACLRRVLQEMLAVGDQGLKLDTKPSVVLFIGVNGVGKTTTIGKLGASLKGEGKKVLLCAGDTFRAAAAELCMIFDLVEPLFDRKVFGPERSGEGEYAAGQDQCAVIWCFHRKFCVL